MLMLHGIPYHDYEYLVTYTPMSWLISNWFNFSIL